MSDTGSAGDLLLSLLRRYRLSHREQAIVITTLLAPTPLRGREIARRTHLAYSHAKAVIRTLAEWQILTRTPEGLAFQPDPSRWGPPMVPSHGAARRTLEHGTTEADLGAEPRLASGATGVVVAEPPF